MRVPPVGHHSHGPPAQGSRDVRVEVSRALIVIQHHPWVGSGELDSTVAGGIAGGAMVDCRDVAGDPVRGSHMHSVQIRCPRIGLQPFGTVQSGNM